MTNRPKAAKKGAYSDALLSDRHAYQTRPTVMNGTGASNAIFGQENQRCAIWAARSGVHRLTTATARIVPIRQRRPSARAQSCNGGSVFITSQPAPSSA